MPDFEVASLACHADPCGALYLPDERTLLVADLHFEKGSALALRGQMLPPYDTHVTLAILTAAIMRHDPRTVIALGDSFHDRRGAERLTQEHRSTLASLKAGRDWIWISGNHDPDGVHDLEGEVMDALVLRGTLLRHEPLSDGKPQIAGHLHPVGTLRMKGKRVRKRCFVTDGITCVLPAYGAYAGGLNVRDEAFTPLFPSGFMAYLTGKDRVFAIARKMLVGD